MVDLLSEPTTSVAPNDGSSSQFEYTLPVVQFPDGKCIMDSLKIARAIEEAHPEPSLRLDSPYVAKMLELDRPLLMASVPAWVSKLPERLLNDSSKQYMYETRQKFLGMHPAEFEKKFGPGSWDKLAPILQQVTDMLKENTAGPFFDGEKAGFADFIWLGFLVFWRTIGDDIWENVLKIMGEDKEVHLKLLEAGEPFIERKSH